MDDVTLAANPARVFLSTRPAAQHISVSPRSLASRRWREARGIPSYKLGPRLLRFDKSELDAWIAARRTGQSAA